MDNFFEASIKIFYDFGADLNFACLNGTDLHKATFGSSDKLGGLNEPSLLETDSRANETESVELVDTM